MSLRGVLKLAAVVLVVRLLFDVSTPLMPGAFVLRPTGIEGVGALHLRTGAAPVAIRDEAPRLRREASFVLDVTAPVVARPAPRPRPSHRPLRLPPKTDDNSRSEVISDH